jgi:cell surface protein SprA
MEVHAEALIGQPLQDDELTLFIRIGSDYKGNFYEYEIPLKLTPPGRYDNNNEGKRAIVWPLENSINIDLSVLQNAKQARNSKMLEPGSSLGISDVFVYAESQS